MTPIRAFRDESTLPLPERVDHLAAAIRNLFLMLVVGVLIQLAAVGLAVWIDQRGQDRDAELRRSNCRARNEERQTIVSILHLFDPTERSLRIRQAVALLRSPACPASPWHDQRPTPTTPAPPGAIP